MTKRLAAAMPLLGAMTCAAHGQCETAKLLASDGGAGDRFGWSLDLNGSMAIVGSASSGSAYVFRFDGGEWVEQTVLTPSSGTPGDAFGQAVAVCGDVAVVGAYLDGENGESAGAAYVYRFNATSGEWTEDDKLLPLDGVPNAWFGKAVAAHKDVVLIGAPSDDEAGSNTGTIYVYRFDGASWVEEAKLFASDGAPSDFFGDPVALDHDLALAGSAGHSGHGSGSGAAYVFRFDGRAWNEEAELFDSQGSRADGFSNALGISGSLAIVGAPNDDDNGGQSGSANVYRFDGSVWLEETKLLASDGMSFQRFGTAVDIGGASALVGALGDASNGLLSGAAYLFQCESNVWNETAKIMPSDAAPLDTFGRSVSLSGDLAIIGADQDDDNSDGSGSAYIFDDLTLGVSACDCPWDCGDDDGVVGINDFLEVLATWGSSGVSCDFDGGGVGITDLLLLLSQWGPCP